MKNDFIAIQGSGKSEERITKIQKEFGVPIRNPPVLNYLKQ